MGNMKIYKWLLWLLPLSFVLVGCSSDDEEVPQQIDVEVVTGDVQDATLTSVILQGVVKAAASNYTEVGIAYCLENSNNMVYAKATDMEYEMGGYRSFSVTLNGLQPDMSYTYYAYVKDVHDNIHNANEQKTFRTNSPDVLLKTNRMQHVAIHDATLSWKLDDSQFFSDLTNKKFNATFGVAWSVVKDELTPIGSRFSAQTKTISFDKGQTSTAKLVSLKASTQYYYTTYVDMNGKLYAAPVSSFITLSEQDIKGTAPTSVEAVDLGLPSGLKWASVNIGAEKPEDTGLFFAWGETEGYLADGSDDHLFSWANYKWCKGSRNNQTKYCSTSSYGVVDNKPVLEFTDDAAYVNWGDEWRMPTAEELHELMENTTSEWTTIGGVDGYQFTSNTTGKTIFLPASGCRVSESNYENGSDCYYWASSVDSESPYASRYLRFYVGRMFIASLFRYYGMNVRPVHR